MIFDRQAVIGRQSSAISPSGDRKTAVNVHPH
jgi:hypothetical protein